MILLNRDENVYKALQEIRSKYEQKNILNWKLFKCYVLTQDEHDVLLRVFFDEDFEITLNASVFEDVKLITRNNLGHSIVWLYIGENHDENPHNIMEIIVVNHEFNKDEIIKAYEKAEKLAKTFTSNDN